MLTTNEATGMYEDTFLDSRKLRERVITNTSPGLRESLATLETFWRHGNSLDAPVTPGFVGVDNVNGLFGFYD